MVAFPSTPILNLRAARSWPAAGAALTGVLVAALATIIPDAVFEALIVGSGLPDLLTVAEPPLGWTARALVALAAGGLVAVVIWSVLYLLVGPGGVLPIARRGAGNAPMVRRADAHPDAPPRWPLSARDLGPPMPPAVAAPPVEQPVPADLDTPLAAVDPAAIPTAPREPVRPVEPLVRPTMTGPGAMAPGERLDVFALTRPNRGAAPKETGAPAPSLAALLDRLEKSVAHRDPAPTVPERASLEETLGSLRQMAMRR